MPSQIPTRMTHEETQKLYEIRDRQAECRKLIAELRGFDLDTDLYVDLVRSYDDEIHQLEVEAHYLLGVEVKAWSR